MPIVAPIVRFGEVSREIGRIAIRSIAGSSFPIRPPVQNVIGDSPVQNGVGKLLDLAGGGDDDVLHAAPVAGFAISSA